MSMPTTETQGLREGELVGGVGALPGSVNETGVAVLPEERNATTPAVDRTTGSGTGLTADNTTGVSTSREHEHEHRSTEAAALGTSAAVAAIAADRSTHTPAAEHSTASAADRTTTIPAADRATTTPAADRGTDAPTGTTDSVSHPTRIPVMGDEVGLARVRLSAPGMDAADQRDIVSLGARVHPSNFGGSPVSRYGDGALPQEDVQDASHGTVRVRWDSSDV
jgi:hypothetical protein